MSRQILRSGTSVAANMKEAVYAQSRKDFVSKMSIALKECSETEYWLDLLFETDYINENLYKSLRNENTEIIRILISIVKNSKKEQD